MIQGKPLAMTEVARTLKTIVHVMQQHFKRRGRMKRLFSFVAKASGLFPRISELFWIILIIILFCFIFIIFLIGIIKL